MVVVYGWYPCIGVHGGCVWQGWSCSRRLTPQEPWCCGLEMKCIASKSKEERHDCSACRTTMWRWTGVSAGVWLHTRTMCDQAGC